MSMIADLAAYDPSGQLALVVEVKSRTDRSRSWAAQMRRNMMAHGVAGNPRFFLLALPDRLYLWKNAGNLPEPVEPTFEIDAAPFFQPYFEAAGVSPSNLTPQSFELIVTSWLNELIRAGVPPTIPDNQRECLQESGLVEAIRGGSVAVEVRI
jgi:hypothetical protein